MVVLITGAASGLGWEFLQQYSRKQACIAIDRVDIPIDTLPDGCQKLVRTFTVDLASDESIRELAKTLNNAPISSVIHSAGVRGLHQAVHAANPTDVRCAETIESMDSATMALTFRINTSGTFLLIKALLPSLELAARNGAKVKVIVMSSRMGSIATNESGAGYAYRASKAALNMIIKSFAVDVPRITFVMMHPGRVETGLVLSKEEGAISAKESVDDMMRLIDSLTREDTGRFMDRFGADIPF